MGDGGRGVHARAVVVVVGALFRPSSASSPCVMVLVRLSAFVERREVVLLVPPIIVHQI